MRRVNLIHNFENFTFPPPGILHAQKNARPVHVCKMFSTDETDTKHVRS